VRVARVVAAGVSVGLVAVLAAYPLLVYAGLSRFGARGVALVLAAASLLRLLTLRLQGRPVLGTGQLVLVCGGGALLAAVSLVQGSEAAVRYYPVLVNGALLTLFAASLASPPTVIERIARLRDPELPPRAVLYTRRVTIAWTLFFAVNGAIALYTAVRAPLDVWALYNGLIAYVLIGALLGGELVVRRIVRPGPRP
jgi:uncharacterized membrane protein